jgi:hypothetical protein
MSVDLDTQGIFPNTAKNVTISNCIFRDSNVTDLIIGTADPNTDGIPVNVNVSGCNFIRNGDNSNSSILVYSGAKIGITGCQFDSNCISSAGYRVIQLYATQGAGYIKDLVINNNYLDGNNPSGHYLVSIPEQLYESGGPKIVITGNQVTHGLTVEWAGDTSKINNPSLFVKSSLNGAFESRVVAPGDATPNVAGVDVLYLRNASGLVNITNFDGGTDGQTLQLLFGDSNTTLQNTNLYLQGSLDFTGSNYDILTLQNRGGYWYETSRSVNN